MYAFVYSFARDEYFSRIVVLIFRCLLSGGKDNNLGHVGKVVLDNIISGKFKRKVKISKVCHIAAAKVFNINCHLSRMHAD